MMRNMRERKWEERQWAGRAMKLQCSSETMSEAEEEGSWVRTFLNCCSNWEKSKKMTGVSSHQSLWKDFSCFEMLLPSYVYLSQSLAGITRGMLGAQTRREISEHGSGGSVAFLNWDLRAMLSGYPWQYNNKVGGGKLLVLAWPSSDSVPTLCIKGFPHFLKPSLICSDRRVEMVERVGESGVYLWMKPISYIW